MSRFRFVSEFALPGRVRSGCSGLIKRARKSGLTPVMAELVNRPSWHRSAACRGVDPDLFFPERGSGRPAGTLAYCEGCTVRSECLDSALQSGSTMGVWGGTTGVGRRVLRRSVA